MVADDMFKIVESAYGKVNIQHLTFFLLSLTMIDDLDLNNEVNQ